LRWTGKLALRCNGTMPADPHGPSGKDRAVLRTAPDLTVGLCAVEVWTPRMIPHGLAGAAESRRPSSSGERSRFAPQER
jgi:hypothetical protein